jgi:cytochrome c-type biogenesis protein CcsB
MERLILIPTFSYILSTAGYIAYLFFQKERLQKIGYVLLFAGFLIHSISIGYGFLQSGYLPVQNLHQTLSIAGWAIAGMFLFLTFRFNLKVLGIYAAPLVAIVMIICMRLPAEGTVVQAKTLFSNIWLVSHVVIIFVGEAAFALACGAGLLYILQERAIKTKHHGFFFKRLPALELLDNTGYACIVVGFSLLTLGLITGFVYAKFIWGSFWSWDPKEVWSGIAWLIYAALLHGRLALGWRGRKAAIMSIIGFGILLFTFLGVNLLLTGHHGEFTKI